MTAYLISLTAYCLLHSLLAEPKIMGKIYHAWWYRFFYVAQSVILFIPLLYMHYTVPSDMLWLPGRFTLLFMAVVWLFGLWFAVYTVKSYDNMSFLGIAQVKAWFRGEKLTSEKPKLTREGALGVVRHPYYFVALVLIWARPLTYKDLYMNIILTIYFIAGTLNEERKLIAEFGGEYRQYMKDVPALIPFTKKRKVKTAHIMFVKYPQAGSVKTRLGRDIGYDKAAEFYKLLVEKIISAVSSGRYSTLIFIDPPERIADFESWLGAGQTFLPQKGDSLGERMHHAFSDVFDMGYKRAVITGSDIPELTADVIERAAAALEFSDMSAGRAEDGGYYLLGLKHDTLSKELFEGIAWSTDTVYADTIAKSAHLGYKVFETETLADIDDITDLKRLEHTVADILKVIDI